MKQLVTAALAAALLATPAAITPVAAQSWHHDRHDNNRWGWRGDHDRRWDPSGSYRYDKRYRARRLSRNDYVYRGRDGRYYCKRNDGTTGLIVGGIGGAALGNVIDGGHNRIAGTLLGGALGALAGKAIDQGNSDVRCR